MTARFLALYETPADPEAFDRHYREIRIPLGCRLPGLRRYAVSRDVAAVRGARSGGNLTYRDRDDGRRRRHGDTPEVLVARVGVHLGLVAEQRCHLTGFGGTSHPCQQ
jgi:hypothetical protein